MVFVLAPSCMLPGIVSQDTAAAAPWWRSPLRQNSVRPRDTVVSDAVQALARLQDLATSAAMGVDHYSSHIKEITDKLTSSDRYELTKVVDMVAYLIQINQHMQERLDSAEDQLHQQARQIQTYAAEARTDALTLLANRRGFDEELGRRIAEFRRQGRPVSLILVDVDRFKRWNDAYGHQLGDQVLRSVARLLCRTMRDMDVVARYGGDEFAVVLPGTALEEACDAAQRACEEIAKSHFHYNRRDLQVTASLGVAQVRGDEDGESLVARADAALYAAKEAGRNCVKQST